MTPSSESVQIHRVIITFKVYHSSDYSKFLCEFTIFISREAAKNTDYKQKILWVELMQIILKKAVREI